MSLIPGSIVRTYGETVGLAPTLLSEDVVTAVAQEVEYRLREIVQEAIKHMHNSKRLRLTVHDINDALELRNVEKLYGYDSGEKLSFRLVPNTNIYIVPREEVDLEAFVKAPLPRALPPLTMTSHWLAVEGISPDIPENAVAVSESQKLDMTAAAVSNILRMPDAVSGDAEVKPLVRHVLSKELQVYFDAVVNDLGSGNADRIKAALYSVATDSGLQQLLPYFVQFVCEGVACYLRNLGQLQVLISLIGSLLANEHLFMEPYLHQVMPPLLSCLLGRRICEHPEQEDHWSLRDRCAAIVADICRKFSHSYATLLPRCVKTMLGTLKDTSRPLAAHYGALTGLMALGSTVMETSLMPILPVYVSNLQMDSADEDLVRVKGVIKVAVEKWMQDTDNEADRERLASLRSSVSNLF